MTYAAIDIGASGGKTLAGAFDGERLVVREVHRFANEPVYAAGTFFWDILRLLHEVKNGIRAANQAGLGELHSIGIDTWGLDFGLLDRAGRLVGNPIHYRDAGHQGAMATVLEIVPRAEIFARTGCQFLPINTLYQWFALKGTPVLEQAATLLLIPDLLRYFLTGERTSEYTNASISQMYNIHDGGWDVELIERLGLPASLLTPIVPAASSGGVLARETQEELGCGEIATIAVGSHDTASAVAAVPARGPFAYLSSGTWSLLGTEIAQPVIDERVLAWNFSNEGGLAGTYRLLKNIMGMWLIERCRAAWARAGTPVAYDEMGPLVDRAPAFAAFINPDDPAFLNPPDMPAAIRAFCLASGQPAPETPGATSRVILESMALTARQVFERAEQLSGQRLPGLHVVGGGIRNRTFLQFLANALGRPVWAGPAEATAIGNLLGQMMAAGEIANLAEGREVVRASFPVETFEPIDAMAWDDAYARFRETIPR